MSSYFFVISSLNHPVYRILQKKRKALFEKYGLSYSVLVNSENRTQNFTYPPLLDDEVLFPMGGYNPSMTLKFLHAVKLFFRSYSRWEDVPDYIVRMNATVYVFFPDLQRYLEKLPRERVLAGAVVNKTFVNGMLMIFSKDVLRNMLADPAMNDERVLREYDDVALTVLARPYCEYHDMMHHFVYGNTPHNSSENGLYDLDAIQPIENEKWVFRIRHDESGRRADTQNWDQLVMFFDENLELFGSSNHLDSPFRNNYSTWLVILMCLVALGLIVAVIIAFNMIS